MARQAHPPGEELNVTSRGKDSYSIQSVENALDVLEALCDQEEVRISHLSDKLGMNKTSVFRLLATFENRGYVERQESSGKYRLGLSAYEMGQKFLSRMGLLRKARPVMEQLVRRCNESVYLIMRRQEEVLFLDMIDTSHQVKIFSLVGRRFPLTGNAAGELISVFCPPPSAADPDGGTQSTNPAPAAVRARVRRDGYCTDCGQLGDGITSIAVPLFDTEGEVPGGLCMVGPDFRMLPERVETELLPAVREAGEIISSKLGHLRRYLEKESF